jgi:predicted ribonuclease YlaK
MSRPSRLRLEHLEQLEPLTKNQEKAFASYNEGNHLILSGSAGTGKTFIALYHALKTVLDKAQQQNKVVIVRSVVPTRDIGYLPGEKEEKEAPYQDLYISVVNELFQDKEAWKKLNQFKELEFMTTSFIRGITIHDAIVIIDEAQNCNFHELCSVITRLGENCRFILSGDFYQSDFVKDTDKRGLRQFINILNNMKHFDHIEFDWKDIVRSGLVRDFIMTQEMLNGTT